MPRSCWKPVELPLTCKWRVSKPRVFVTGSVLAHLCLPGTRSLLKVWHLYSYPLNILIMLFQKYFRFALHQCQHVSFTMAEKSRCQMPTSSWLEKSKKVKGIKRNSLSCHLFPQRNGEYTLHTRCIIEMEQYILSNYQDMARKCYICHSLAIQVTCSITSAGVCRCTQVGMAAVCNIRLALKNSGNVIW